MKKLWVILVLIACCIKVDAQKINQLNKKGQRTGRWINYEDSAKTIKSFDGRFKKGYAVGKASYYAPGGVLDRIEISRFRRLKTTMYYPNGKVRLKGRAKIENLPNKIHYYFYGRWKYYDTEGHLLKYCYYKKGELIRTKVVNRKLQPGDSLTRILNSLDSNFNERNKFMITRINRAETPFKKEMLRESLYKQDSVTFSTVEKIIKKYDYPPKILVGESCVIPFYIMSFASKTVRESFVPVFIRAAERGDLAWSSVAIYIDKVKIAFGKEQVYGTQFDYDKRGRKIYYPIEDKAHLNERRKKVGLGEFEE